MSNETRAILNEVTKYGQEMVRPAGIGLDKLFKPEEVIAPGSRLWDVFKGFYGTFRRTQ